MSWFYLRISIIIPKLKEHANTIFFVNLPKYVQDLIVQDDLSVLLFCYFLPLYHLLTSLHSEILWYYTNRMTITQIKQILMVNFLIRQIHIFLKQNAGLKYVWQKKVTRTQEELQSGYVFFEFLYYHASWNMHIEQKN